MGQDASAFQGVENWSPWKGTSPEGRWAYVTPLSDNEFLAYGVQQSSGQVVFVLRGSINSDLKAFYIQMRSDRAEVRFFYKSVLEADTPPPGFEAIEDFAQNPPFEDGAGEPTPKTPTPG